MISLCREIIGRTRSAGCSEVSGNPCMESYGEDSVESDAFSSKAELAGTVIKGPSPENVGRLLVEAEDSDPAYS